MSLTAADVVIDGALSAPASDVRIERSAGGTLAIGDATGDMTIDHDELKNITGLSLILGGVNQSVNILVQNVQEEDLINVAGAFTLDATGPGAGITFQNANSTFLNLTALADNGIQVNADIATTQGGVTLDADFDGAADGSDALSFAVGRTINSAADLVLRAATGGISSGGSISLLANNGVAIDDSFTAGGTVTINSDADGDGTGTARHRRRRRALHRRRQCRHRHHRRRPGPGRPDRRRGPAG